jgi:hypothetical protein
VTITDRDRRALVLLGVAAVLIIGWRIFSAEDKAGTPVVAVSDIPTAEKRLQRMRQLAAAVPGKHNVLQQVRSELASREAGLIQADTAAQAQAQLAKMLRGLATKNNLDLRNTEIGQVRPFGEDYGEVLVSASFESGIEQLLNLMADLTAQKEMIATSDLRIGSANPKQKTMPVRLTVSGLVRRGLVADKKGAAAF